MDKIRFYCGYDGLFMPTSTPTQQVTVPDGTEFYELEWLWWAFTAIAIIVVAMCYRVCIYFEIQGWLQRNSIQGVLDNSNQDTDPPVQIIRNDRRRWYDSPDSPISDEDKEGSSM